MSPSRKPDKKLIVAVPFSFCKVRIIAKFHTWRITGEICEFHRDIADKYYFPLGILVHLFIRFHGDVRFMLCN